MSKKLIVEATITKTVEEKLTVDVSGRAADDIQQYLDDAYCTMEGWELRDVGTTESEFAAEMKLVDRNYTPNPAGGASPEFEAYYDEYRLKGDEDDLHLTDYEKGFLRAEAMRLFHNEPDHYPVSLPEDEWHSVGIPHSDMSHLMDYEEDKSIHPVNKSRTFDINYGWEVDETDRFYATAYLGKWNEDGTKWSTDCNRGFWKICIPKETQDA